MSTAAEAVLEAAQGAFEAPLCPSPSGEMVCFFCGVAAARGAKAVVHLPVCAVPLWRAWRAQRGIEG